MLEIFGWNVGMGNLAVVLLLGGALVIGLIAQVIGETRTGWEWLVAGIGALVGGWLGSEAFGSASTWGWAVENLYIFPALIGGVVVGAMADIFVRTVTGGSYIRHARPV